MSKNLDLLAIMAFAGLMLLVAPLVASAESIVTPTDAIADFDEVDIWKIKCANPTQICADVNSFGSFNDNGVYVNVVCRKGKGDMEFATGGTISSSACVNNCKEATVLFHCDDGTPCDESYDSLMECVNQPFVSGFPKQTKDKD